MSQESRRTPVPFLLLVAVALGLEASGATPVGAQIAAEGDIPPDTVTTLTTDLPLVGLGNLGGVTTDVLGFVYVANFRDAVWRIGPDGGSRLVTDALYGSSGNAVDARGDLYQSNFNGNTITRVRRTGEVETLVDEGLSGPVGLTFDPEGNLYVCNCTGGFISRVTPEGAVEEFARDSGMACPNGIVRDDRGDFYVVNFNSPVIHRITPDGTVHAFTQVSGAGGNGHITFMRGSFFVTQLRGHAVYRVSRTGEVALLAGDGQPEVRDGPAHEARFSYPNGIAADPSGKILWVNDLVGPYNERRPTEMALRRIRLVTLGDVVEAALGDAPGADQGAVVERLHRTYHEAKPWDDTRAEAVTVGYRLLSTGRIAGALALFRANAEAYSEDAGANYHLGEAYRYTGQPESAARQYRRTLELDPDFPQAAARLAMVGGGTGALPVSE